MSIASSEGSIAADEHAVWMPMDGGAHVAKIDPERNGIAVRIPVPAGSFAAATDHGAVWVSSTDTNQVSRIDPATDRIAASIAVGPKPRYLAVGFGAVWVLNQGDGTISRIDPSANRVVATIALEIPGDGGDIAVGAGAVWATSLGKPLARIDPDSNRVMAQFIGEGGDALRIGMGAVWLCSFAASIVADRPVAHLAGHSIYRGRSVELGVPIAPCGRALVFRIERGQRLT